MMKSKNETMWTEDGSVCMCTTRREATEKVRKWTIGGSMFMAAELKKAPGACFSRMPLADLELGTGERWKLRSTLGGYPLPWALVPGLGAQKSAIGHNFPKRSWAWQTFSTVHI